MIDFAITITAADLAEAVVSGHMGKLESALYQHAARVKKHTMAESVLVKLDFPADVGGVELRCRRMGPLARLAWKLGYAVTPW